MKNAELVQALLAGIALLASSAVQAEPTLVLQVPEGTIRAGEAVLYGVGVAGMDRCRGLCLDFSYDPGHLEVLPIALAPVLIADRKVASAKTATPGNLTLDIIWGERLTSDGDTLALCSVMCQVLDSDPSPPSLTLRNALTASGPSLASSRPEAKGSPGTTVSQFALAQNRPNPFNPETAISFDLPGAAAVTITVYHVSGRRIGTIVDHQLFPPGSHTVRWDGRDNQGNAVPAGLYFCRIEAGSWASSTKMVVVR